VQTGGKLKMPLKQGSGFFEEGENLFPIHEKAKKEVVTECDLSPSI
jgi:hypothetical protein